MATRSVRYDTLIRGDLDPLAASEVWDAVWQDGPDVTGPWPASTPATPTDEFDLNGPEAKIISQIGYTGAGGTGTITAELIVGGSTIDSHTWTLPADGSANIWELKNPSHPTPDAYADGSSVVVRVTNDTDEEIKVSSEEVEADLYVMAEEVYDDGGGGSAAARKSRLVWIGVH